MSTKLEEFKKEQQKKETPQIVVGNTIKVTQNINGKKQSFQGLVIAKKHGTNTSGTITVRSILDKIGTEKIFPLHSPTIEKIEIVKNGVARKSKIYYIRDKSKRVAQRKIKSKR